MMYWMPARFRCIPWILRYLEWGFIAIAVWSSWRNGVWSNNLECAWQTATILIGFAGLSIFFPRAQPLWLRRGYIGCGVLLFALAATKGLSLDVFLYLYLAKNCFLLNRRQAIVTAAIAGIIITAIPIWGQSTPIKFEAIWHLTTTQTLSKPEITLDISTDYLIPSIITMIFCFTLIAEQKSRFRAEGLAREVETLVATLERQRIAREIHDSLGHTLTTLNIHLAVAKKWYQRDVEKTLHALNIAKSLAEQCIEEVRQTLQTMRASDFDLNQALVSLMEQVEQNHLLQVQWQIHLPPLPLQTSHHIYCIVREGLINVQKHAHANQVDVRVVTMSDRILMEVVDDGLGFDLKADRVGLGLRGIQERVQLLGGQFMLDTTLGRGTKLQVTVPLL